ncbi:MAG: type II toxin-antitoxin system PemK/MazF family toxin [Acidimicrobiales bacterium]
MHRREIRLVNLDPVVGSEAAHTRPGVIVSNDGATTTAQRLGRGVITVVPVTSNIDNVYPFQTLLPSDETGLDVDSKAQAEQVRSVAIERIGTLIGTVPFHLMDQLDDALRLHLDL